MRKFFTLKTNLLAIVLGAMVVSCGSDDNTEIIQTDPEIIPSASIDITFDSTQPEGSQRTGTFSAIASGEAGGVVKGRVKFTSDKDMRRLYVTRTLPGGEPEPFVFQLDKATTRKLTKPDGSIDLDNAEKTAFDFSFDLDVPSSATAGEIIYNFWATSGRGDFRDPSKRLLVGVGTIEVEVGVPVGQELVSKEVVILAAPLADGSSSTFISFFDLDRTYKINEGAEFSTFWDFGYFYGNTLEASLASTNNYPSDIFDLLVVTNEGNGVNDIPVVKDDLKKVYFKKNNSLAFDSVTNLSELNGLIDSAFSVSDSDPQRVTKLIVGDVVEFLDTSGRKGMIKIAAIDAGFTGKITLSIKTQPATPIMEFKP